MPTKNRIRRHLRRRNTDSARPNTTGQQIVDTLGNATRGLINAPGRIIRSVNRTLEGVQQELNNVPMEQRNEEVRKIGSQNKEGKYWAGQSYGWQSKASYERLKKEGHFRFGEIGISRIGNDVVQGIDKGLKDKATKAVKDAAGKAKEIYDNAPKPVQQVVDAGGNALRFVDDRLEDVSRLTNTSRFITDEVVTLGTAKAASAAIKGVKGATKGGRITKAVQRSTKGGVPARSVGAAARPGAKANTASVRETLDTNVRRLRGSKAQSPETPKTAGRSAKDVGAEIKETKAGNFIVKGKEADVTIKPEPFETKAQTRQRAEVYARGLDYVQSRSEPVARRIKAPRFRDDVAQRPNTNQYVGRLRRRSTDGETTSKGRIKSAQERARSKDAAAAARRAEAKSDVPRKPADAPLGGTASDPKGTGVMLGGKRPVPNKRISKRLAKKELEQLDAGAKSRGNRIKVGTTYETKNGRGYINFADAVELKPGERGNMITGFDQRSMRSMYRSALERTRIAENSAARRKFERAMDELFESTDVDEFGVPSEFKLKPGVTEKDIARAQAKVDEAQRMEGKRRSIKDRIETRRFNIKGKGLGAEPGDYLVDGARHPGDRPINARRSQRKRGKRGARQEMSPENREAQRQRTERDLAANPLRREGRSGGAKVKTLPGRDPLPKDKDAAAKQVWNEIIDDLNRQFDGDQEAVGKYLDDNKAIIDQRFADRLDAPQSPIKWRNRFTAKDPQTGTTVPTDVIPERSKSRIKERLNKGDAPTRSETGKRKQLEDAGELLPDFTRASGKKLKEINQAFVEAVSLSGELKLNDAGELVRRRIRRRKGAEGRATKGSTFNADEFRFSDIDRTGGSGGRGGRKLNQQIRARERTLDYEEFFEEMYPRSAYPEGSSPSEVMRMRNEDFARDYPETARIMGGILKTDNPAGKASIRNQFRETAERQGRPSRINRPRRSTADTSQGRTVPIGPTVLDEGKGLGSGRVRRSLSQRRRRAFENRPQNLQAQQEAKANTAVKKDRLRRQLLRRRNRN